MKFQYKTQQLWMCFVYSTTASREKIPQMKKLLRHGKKEGVDFHKKQELYCIFFEILL